MKSTEQGIDLDLMIPAGVLPGGEGMCEAAVEREEGLGLVCSSCGWGGFAPVALSIDGKFGAPEDWMGI